MSQEWVRGLKESAAGIETLRSLWPVAFPKKPHLVKPLVVSIPQVAEQTGWSKTYTRGVLHAWKCRSAYCLAVLQNERRYNLDGKELADTVIDDQSREQARQQLAAIAARRLKEEEKRAAKAPTGMSSAVG
jgi:sRNA-binding protein